LEPRGGSTEVGLVAKRGHDKYVNPGEDYLFRGGGGRDAKKRELSKRVGSEGGLIARGTERGRGENIVKGQETTKNSVNGRI